MELLDFGNQNHVLHARSQRHHWHGAGLLSIKTFRGGQALYEGDAYARHLVDDQTYLILNHGQSYAITIDADHCVESFCVFFAAGFVEDVYRNLREPDQHLLDDPWPGTTAQASFFERTYPHDNVLSPALGQLRTAHAQGHGEPGALHEHWHNLARALLHVHREITMEVGVLPAVRAVTRDELYRRLYRARDYMHAAYQEPIVLDDMARVACMSPHHFLRMFKLTFGVTPHQYLMSIRLQQAQQLLLHTENPVTDICFAVGFASLGSFSWLFKRRTGLSPQEYRAQKPQF